MPVHDQHGHLLGALNVSTNAARVPKEKLEQEFLPLLQDTSRQIERTIG